MLKATSNQPYSACSLCVILWKFEGLNYLKSQCRGSQAG